MKKLLSRLFPLTLAGTLLWAVCGFLGSMLWGPLSRMVGENTSPGAARLLLTLLIRCPFSEENIRTDFLDFCLTHIYSAEEPTAVKCLYMKLAYAQCKLFPELASELRKTLEFMEDDLPAGMKSTRKNILKQLGNAY